MTAVFAHLSRPLALRGQVLRNRIVFGAHTANMAEDGLPGPRYIEYLRARARGGAAMVVCEPVPAHPSGVLTRGNFRCMDDAVIPAFQALTQAVKSEGAVVIQQIYHIGAHGDSDLSYHPHWSPSGDPSYHDSDGSHEMTGPEVEELLEAHLAAARRAHAAGFDGVEVWAAYHSLIDQFWTPWSNRRCDNWGGSLENRTRFSRLLIEGIRRDCGPDFIIGLAISHSEAFPVTLQAEDLAEIVALHDATGNVDYVTVGAGSYLDFARIIPPFTEPEKLTTPFTALLRQRLTHAIVTAEAGIRTPENAETVLGAAEADLVSIVRGQIADPDLAAKAVAGQANRVRGCLSCNQMCWGRRSRDYWISCLINPSVGREWEGLAEPFAPSPTPRRVLVVGAGPAGLEAARVAALRGHRVTLAEAAADIGGQFRLAGLQPRRAQILDLLGWYGRELDRAGVDLRLNCFVDADVLAELQADAVVLATGSLPDDEARQRWLPQVGPLPGLEVGRVWSPEAVMRREMRPSGAVIVYDEGGTWRGVGTAWALAEAGHRVTLVTPDALVGKELQRTAADGPARARLTRLGVGFVTEHVITRWHGQGARLKSLLDGSETEQASTDLVMATTNRAFDPLSSLLSGCEHHRIGDCAAPRQAAFAFYDGRTLGMRL